MNELRSVRRLSGPLALVLALAPAAPVLAQTAPRLAPGVAKASDYTPPPQTYVAAADNPVYLTMDMFGPTKGQVKMGEKLNVIAEAEDHNWLLLGQGGEGIGYLPRSLATPSKYAYELKSSAS